MSAEQNHVSAEQTLREWKTRQHLNPAQNKQYEAALKAERDGTTYEIRAAATEERKKIEKKIEKEIADQRLLGLNVERDPAKQRDVATTQSIRPELSHTRAQAQFVERQSAISASDHDRPAVRSRER